MKLSPVSCTLQLFENNVLFTFITNGEVQSVGLMVGLLSVGAGHLQGMSYKNFMELNRDKCKSRVGKLLTFQPDFLKTVNGF